MPRGVYTRPKVATETEQATTKARGAKVREAHKRRRIEDARALFEVASVKYVQACAERDQAWEALNKAMVG
jgi:hypothetical protein